MSLFLPSTSAHPLRHLVLCIVAFGTQAMAQPGGIEVRFEPGCEFVKAYFRPVTSGASSYTWDFGDNSTSTLTTPMHAYPLGTPVTVQLTVVDLHGEATTYSEQFTTQQQLDFVDIELPNVFTPNGDGHNDEFAPLVDRLLGPCAQLTVYNRYGQRMFESLGNDLSWDGRTVAGEAASDGVYFYVFAWGGSTLNSTVTLVR